MAKTKKQETAMTLRVQKGALLPDQGQWENRFEVRSSSSNRVYRVAQHAKLRHWGCSCPGWCNHRKCKHLSAMGLPALEKPMEVKMVVV